MKTMADRDKRDTNNPESAVARSHGWLLDKKESITEFYNETRYEMQRVTWPTREQVQSTTIVVILTVFFFGAFFYVADSLIMGPFIAWLFKKLAQGS
jgi:preprotein translocase subunit SecE